MRIAAGPMADSRAADNETRIRQGASRMPVRPSLIRDEALDSYLERLARVNLLDNPGLLAQLANPPDALWMLLPDQRLIADCAQLAGLNPADIEASTLSSLAGFDIRGPYATVLNLWRAIASRGWAPAHGSQVCPECLAHDSAWRIPWRHPWVTSCLTHGCWLHATCPSCRRPFRSQRHPLMPTEATAHTCGNPTGTRGRACRQPLAELSRIPCPLVELSTQRRVDRAIHGIPVKILGQLTDPASYLLELKALTVLLLHLACCPGGDRLAGWAHAAVLDRERSSGGRGARWGLAPPHDPVLRGNALSAADTILTLDPPAAAQTLASWLDLTPPTGEGQVRWLADRTTMTPSLTRIVMAATSARVRLSTRLARTSWLPRASIPQVLPSDLYRRCLASHLDVGEPTGRLFASLCLARRGQRAGTWEHAAGRLGLPATLGVKTARACTSDLLCPLPEFVEALNATAAAIPPNVDYLRREQAVREHATAETAPFKRATAGTGLVETDSGEDWWIAFCAATGARIVSRRYAIAWLWTTYACGHLSTSPGWDQPPSARERAYYRRYVSRMTSRTRRTLARQATDWARSLPTTGSTNT